MTPKAIAGANANPGAPSDWDAKRDGTCGRLPIRAEFYDSFGQQHVKHCDSAWQPSPEELALLNAGGQVVLRVIGWQVPVSLRVEPS
jgi:hypothetical protein